MCWQWGYLLNQFLLTKVLIMLEDLTKYASLVLSCGFALILLWEVGESSTTGSFTISNQLFFWLPTIPRNSRPMLAATSGFHQSPRPPVVQYWHIAIVIKVASEYSEFLSTFFLGGGDRANTHPMAVSSGFYQSLGPMLSGNVLWVALVHLQGHQNGKQRRLNWLSLIILPSS